MTTKPCTIQVVDWDTWAPSLTGIRRRVFVEEQHVPEAEEWDGLDDDAQHFLVQTAQGQPVGAARVVITAAVTKQPGTPYHIGRVAVLSGYRGQGIGSRLMEAIVRWCHQCGRPKPAHIHLNAQLERLEFYRRLGFAPRGQVFMDAGIAHQAMVLEKP